MFDRIMTYLVNASEPVFFLIALLLGFTITI